MEWVLEGEGVAAEKIDGSCCAIPCCEPDEVTGHWPHWVKVNPKDRGDMWHMAAYQNSNGDTLPNGTYEVICPHFRNNPHSLEKDILVKHGEKELAGVPRSFEGIKEYLEEHYIEGIVFWKDGKPRRKIKRSDFGFEWNCGKKEGAK